MDTLVEFSLPLISCRSGQSYSFFSSLKFCTFLLIISSLLITPFFVYCYSFQCSITLQPSNSCHLIRLLLQPMLTICVKYGGSSCQLIHNSSKVWKSHLWVYLFCYLFCSHCLGCPFR